MSNNESPAFGEPVANPPREKLPEDALAEFGHRPTPSTKQQLLSEAEKTQSILDAAQRKQLDERISQQIFDLIGKYTELSLVLREKTSQLTKLIEEKYDDSKRITLIESAKTRRQTLYVIIGTALIGGLALAALVIALTRFRWVRNLIW